MRCPILLIVLVLAWHGANAQGQACPPTPQRDALRQIAQCLAGQDCRGRSVVTRENLGPGCEGEIEVWAWNAARSAVAIRDRKMCLSRRRADPTAGFVHGLLIPLGPACGVEDPALTAPDALLRPFWVDAWNAARTRLGEDEIVLVINPPTLRSLTHLHVHIMRGNDTPFPAGEALMLDDLGDVWRQAARFAAGRPAMAGGNYGIAVRKQGTRFAMLVEAGAPANLRNPEQKYAVDED